MTGRERIINALKGNEVDRIPIMIQGAPINKLFPEKDHFTLGWMSLPEYKNLFDEYQDKLDTWENWVLIGRDEEYIELNIINRFMVTSPKYIKYQKEQINSDLIRYKGWIDTPQKRLTWCNELQRGVNTLWRIEHVAKSIDDLIELSKVPFEFNVDDIDLDNYERIERRIGDRGIASLFISEPFVTMACAMDYQELLLASISEKKKLHFLLDLITERILFILKEFFKRKKYDNYVVKMGGFEDAVPPMMSIDSFKEFIVPYAGKIIKYLKEQNFIVHAHCHGKVKEILPLFISMGLDSTDPIEPPPQGNITFKEAYKSVDGKLTLVGNIECSDLQNSSPDFIRNQVKEIMSLGKKRIILTDSAPQISAFSSKMADNYRVMIDTALENS